MYDLKVNCAFMPHKGDAKKPTVGNFGVKCSACIAREYKIVVDRGARQV